MKEQGMNEGVMEGGMDYVLNRDKGDMNTQI